MLDEIVEIIELDEEETMDIEVDGNHLFFANDILVHNSAIETPSLNQGHIQGGMSKVNTADALVAIIQTEQMRAAGEYMFEFLKIRNSGGTGKKVMLRWNPISLLVSNLNSDSSTLNLVKGGGSKKTDFEMPTTGTIFNKGGNDSLNKLFDKL